MYVCMGKIPSYWGSRLCLTSGGGNGFSDQGCGRTFGDGMITVGMAGGFFPYYFCKSRMCPAVIGIVPDLHTKPRPKAFIKYQVGHHAFLPWMLYWGWSCGVCSAPAGSRVSFLGLLGGQQSIRENEELWEMPLSGLPVDFCGFFELACELSCASLSPGEGIRWCG